MRKSKVGKILVGAILSAAVFSLAAASPASATNIGNEGCTPGYWKNHTDNWETYTPQTTLGSVFTIPAQLSDMADDTFLEALNYQGGSGVQGAAQILMRAAVAAFLNAAHEGLGYPYRRFSFPGNMLASVNKALASLDRPTMLRLAEKLDAANNLGCPLN